MSDLHTAHLRRECLEKVASWPDYALGALHGFMSVWLEAHEVRQASEPEIQIELEDPPVREVPILTVYEGGLK